MRDRFYFYREFCDALEGLPREIRVEVLDAVIEYGLNGTESVELKPVARSLFSMMKKKMEPEYNRAIGGEKGREFGKLGGRPKKTDKEKVDNPSKTPLKPLDNPSKTPLVTPLYPLENQEKEESSPAPLKEEKDKEKEDSIGIESKKSEISATPRESRLDYKSLMTEFNGTLGGAIPRIVMMNDSRKTALRCRLREHGEESFAVVLAKVKASKFLCGANDKGWRADFDWIMNPKNYAKILEGNYDDEPVGYEDLGINWEKAKTMYNQLGLVKLIDFDEDRKRMFAVIVRTYGVSAMKETYKKAKESVYLHGINRKGWKADFDFLFTPKNFRKVMEGSYDNPADTVFGTYDD